MPNPGKITEIIDDVARKQISDLKTLLADLDKQFIDTAASAAKLNSVVGSAKTTGDLGKAQQAQANAIDKVTAAQERARLAEIRLQQAREKAFDDYEKRLAQQQVLSDKAAAKEEARLARLQANADKAAANAQKIEERRQASEARTEQQRVRNEAAAAARAARDQARADQQARPYVQLTQRLREAEAAAADIGATLGAGSTQFTQAAAGVQALRTQVDAIEQPIGRFQRNVGNYASQAFGIIRQIAYILPGIGIAGIFGLITNGIVSFYQALSTGESIQTTFNTLIRKTNDLYAEQIGQVKLLVAEVEDQNTTGLRRQEILEQLVKLSPQYFGGLKTEKDIVDKLPAAYDKYNAALLLTSRIQAASTLIGEKYKDVLKLQQDIIEGNDTANEDRAGGFAALRELSVSLDQLAQPGKERQIKKLQDQIGLLSKGILDDNKKLQQNGGDIAGTGIALQERLANADLEIQKIKLQTQIDAQNSIAANDQKTYDVRFKALQTSASDQTQAVKLNQKQQLNDVTVTSDARKVIEAKSSADILKINQDLADKQRDLRDKASKQDLANFNQDLELEKKKSKNVADDPNKTYDTRLDALTDYLSASKELIDRNEQEQLKDAGDNTKSIYNVQVKAANDRLQVENEVNASIVQINKEANTKLIQLLKAGAKEQEDIEKETIAKYRDLEGDRLLVIEQNKADALSGLADQYKQGLISQESYENQRTDIERQSSQDSIKQQIITTQAIIDLQKGLLVFGIGSGKDLAKSEQELTKQKIALSKQETDAKLQDAQKVKEARTQQHDLELQLANDVAEFVKTAVDAGYQNRINQLKDESDAVDKNTQQQLDAVSRSVGSEKQKADQTALINAKAQQQKDVIAQKERKIQHDQAVFDKAFNIAKALESVALSEVKALDYLTNPLTAPLYPAIAALIGAIGAVNVATIIAQPIPAFKDGVRDKKTAGLGIWGEAGIELGVMPDGTAMLSPDKATLDYMPKGMNIFSHKELMRMVSKPDLPVYAGGREVDVQSLIAESKRSTSRLETAFTQREKVSGFSVNSTRRARWESYKKRNLN